MSSDAAAMAAAPGEPDRSPDAPRSDAAGPVARLRPVPDTEPGTGPPEQAAPASAFDAVPMPDLSTGLAPGPLAEHEPETAGPPPPGQPPDDGQAGALAPRTAGRPDSTGGAPVAGLTGPVEVTERAVIGDELRAPGVWCELTPCISHHIDPGALGEGDVRERAVEAGWRYDALGRLTCPACQQTDTRFRGTQAVVRWERDAAITMAALMVAGHHELQRDVTAVADQTAVIPALPDAVIPPGSSQDPARQPAMPGPPAEASVT